MSGKWLLPWGRTFIARLVKGPAASLGIRSQADVTVVTRVSLASPATPLGRFLEIERAGLSSD